MEKPKISVIIPIYNMARYLNQTLTEWTNQTLSEIEIVAVDDGSSDDTPALLKQWEQKDSRIRVFSFPENRGTWSARLLGVREARGEYMMFADADDGIEPDACEILYREIKKHPVDILHFSADIINVNNRPKSEIEAIQEFLLPYKGTIRGKNILLKCFRDYKYRYTLWNKLISTELCKRALMNQEECMLTKGEDGLAYFMIAYDAHSYLGFRGKPLYHYYYGRGGEGLSILNPEQFERLCSLATVAQKAEIFVAERSNAGTEKAAARRFGKELLGNCVGHWYNKVAEKDKGACFDLMMACWQPTEVIACMAENRNADKYAIAKQLRHAQSLEAKRCEVKTIATYYYSICNGGTERVLCALCRLWVEMGYQVIVLTDDPADRNDYQLPDSVKRIVIPDYRTFDEENYLERAAALYRIIKDHHIDVFVNHAWESALMLWDEMIVKSAGAWFIGHCHSVFSMELLSTCRGLKGLIAPYWMTDAVVTLSSYDRLFWSHFNHNVFQVNNPLTGEPDEWQTSKCGNHQVLWLARIAPEKRPFDALAIIRSVVNRVPDAKLIVVGSGNEPEYEWRFRAAIISMGLKSNVILKGFQKDVKPWYQNASVFLLTSELEGYCLTLQESMLAGLPTVMYELPHLTLTKNNPGIVTVRQQGVEEAADAIVQLLLDDEGRKRRGRLAREYIEGISQYDYRGIWTDIFESLSQPHTQQLSEDEYGMMETLVLHQDAGYQKARDGMHYGGRRTVKAAVMVLKVKDCLHEKGVKYTAKKVLKKVTGK